MKDERDRPGMTESDLRKIWEMMCADIRDDPVLDEPDVGELDDVEGCVHEAMAVFWFEQAKRLQLEGRGYRAQVKGLMELVRQADRDVERRVVEARVAAHRKGYVDALFFALVVGLIGVGFALLITAGGR